MTNRKRILISRQLPDTVLQKAKAAHDIVVRESTDPMSVDEAKACLNEFDGAIPTLGDGFSAEAFASTKPLRCRILANFGVGYNHIDVAAAEWHGITVTNTPGAVTDATADIALTLILTVARRAGEGERMIRAGQWQGWQPTQLLGHHVTGSTLGIIGMGRIGQAIAQRGHFGFNMKVVYYNRSPKDSLTFPAEPRASAEDVMRASDFVVIAVTASPSSHHLVDAKLLHAMQSHAFLINISRGEVIDEAALITALAEQRIGGAGLDVYEFEPNIPRRLTKLENVVLLPHLGTSVLPVREAMGLMAIDNLNAFVAGETPPNRV